MPKRRSSRSATETSPINRAISLASAFLLTAFLVPVPQSAYAEPANDDASVMETLADSLYLPEGASLSDGPEKGLAAGLDDSYINANLPEASAFSSMPQKFDLRTDTGIEGGAVTPVKLQDPWGTCWAFSSISSIESALILSGQGTADTVDLSERHTAWFSYMPVNEQQAEDLGAPGQGGEGVYVVDGASLWLSGAETLHAAQFFTSDQGPVDESVAPYRNDEGILGEWIDPSTGEAYYSYWSPEGTWSLDESLRFGGDSGISCSVDGVTLLSLPMQDAGSGETALNQSALDAVKQAIMENGAVDASYCGDDSQPDESGEGVYFNYNAWSQYTYEPCESNHTVSIVGWDDSYPKDGFVEGHDAPGDGAWIVKNSWGCADGGEGNTYVWGIDGTGYFYLSYYDQSVSSLISYSMEDAGDETDARLQYDLVGIDNAFDNPLMMDGATQVANVFTAPYDMTLGQVSAYAQIAGSDVSVEVRALDEGDDPDEGVLLASTQRTFDTAGYRRIDLPEEVELHEGQRFSVVEEIRANYGGAERWIVPIERYSTDKYASEMGDPFRANVVCNPGESFIGTNGSWQDACTMSDDETLSDNGNIAYGNFMIKAFGNKADLDDEVSVVFTNDVHCAIDRTVDDAGIAVNAGYGAVAGVADDEKRENGTANVSLVDAGDALQGGAVGTLTEGSAIVDIMNAAGYDYAVPGNHEFDYGMERFLSLVEDSDAQYLSCNFEDERTGDSVLAPYAVQEYPADPGAGDEDGVLKVGYVGISTPETLTKSSPSNFQDDSGNYIYGFEGGSSGSELYASVQAAVDAARADGADYVIAIGHLGNGGITPAWTSRSVIANTTGIDAFIDGHSHETYVDEVEAGTSASEGSASVQTTRNAQGESVLLAQTGTKLANVGLLTIDPDAEGDAISIELKSAQDCTTIDQRAQDAVDKVNAELSQELDQVAGESEVDLLSEDPDSGLYVRYQETNLGDFVADAYRARLGADIGLVNGGGVRSSIAAGDVTKGDLINVQPFGNELCLVEVSGQTILDALEMGARELPDPSGGFLQVSGLSYKIDASMPSSVVVDEHGSFVSVEGERRVHDVRVGGEPLEADKLYTVASHGYMLLEGGDGMSMFKGATVLLENVMIDNQALIDYMTQDLGGRIGQEYASPQGQSRIVMEARPEEAPQGGGTQVDDSGNGVPTGKVNPTKGGDDDAFLVRTGDASLLPLIAASLLSLMLAAAAVARSKR